VDANALVDRFSARTLRIVGVAVVIFGVPSTVIAWSDQGAVWGIFMLVVHLYLGALIAFGLPWLQRRRASRSLPQ